MNLHEPLICYRPTRAAPTSYYVRDARGHQYCVSAGGGVRKGAWDGPVYYGRVDFTQGAAWRARSRSRLRARFNQQANRRRKARRITYSDTLRKTTKVMNQVMLGKFGERLSATNYVGKYCRIDRTVLFEWCHLAAHGFGGPDEIANIVAGTVECNSEQLIIENALWQYRNEGVFEAHVSASLLGNGAAEHIGDVIRYRIYAEGEKIFTHYIDCFTLKQPVGAIEASLYELVVAALNDWLSRRFPVDADGASAAMDAVREHVKPSHSVMAI